MSALSRYFACEGSTDTEVSVDSLSRVYDSIDIRDAFSLKTSADEVVEGKKKEGFIKSNLKKGLKDILNTVVAVATGGITLDELLKVTGVSKFREWLKTRSAINLAELDNESLISLLGAMKSSGEFSNRAELQKAVQAEITARRRELAELEKERRRRQQEQKSGDGQGSDAEGAEDVDLEKEQKALDEFEDNLDEALEDEAYDDENWDKPSEDAEGSDNDNEGAEALPWPVLEDLQPIIYGRTSLPKGHYLLSASGVSSSSIEDFTVSWPIEAVISWGAYKDYLSAVSSGDTDAESFAGLVDSVEDAAATGEYAGMDFMDFLLSNETSGDVEVEWGYMPSRDYPATFVAVVNKTNGAFTLFAPASVKGSMIPIGGFE